MRGAVLYAPGDVRLEARHDPKIVKPTDAVIRTVATCVCGSDLWSYRGINPVDRADPDRPRVRRHRRGGRQRRQDRQAGPVRHRLVLRLRQHLPELPRRLPDVMPAPRVRQRRPGASRSASRWPTAPWSPPRDSPTTSSSRACWPCPTSWAPAGTPPSPPTCKPGMTVAVVGDGAVGLFGVLSAAQLGAERIIAMSRHEPRQKLALEFGATDIVAERGDDGVARIKELTDGIGADAVLECVGTSESMTAGAALHPPRRQRRLRRRPPWRRDRGRGAVLLPRRPARRPGTRAPLPARPHRPGLQPRDRPRQGVRPDPAP